jgi:hypothetical protein
MYALLRPICGDVPRKPDVLARPVHFHPLSDQLWAESLCLRLSFPDLTNKKLVFDTGAHQPGRCRLDDPVRSQAGRHIGVVCVFDRPESLLVEKLDGVQVSNCEAEAASG